MNRLHPHWHPRPPRRAEAEALHALSRRGLAAWSGPWRFTFIGCATPFPAEGSARWRGERVWVSRSVLFSRSRSRRHGPSAHAAQPLFCTIVLYRCSAMGSSQRSVFSKNARRSALARPPPHPPSPSRRPPLEWDRAALEALFGLALGVKGISLPHRMGADGIGRNWAIERSARQHFWADPAATPPTRKNKPVAPASPPSWDCGGANSTPAPSPFPPPSA
jgi:hypothetical protein